MKAARAIDFKCPTLDRCRAAKSKSTTPVSSNHHLEGANLLAFSHFPSFRIKARFGEPHANDWVDQRRCGMQTKLQPSTCNRSCLRRFPHNAAWIAKAPSLSRVGRPWPVSQAARQSSAQRLEQK